MCTVIGDTNIDYLKWVSPDPSHKRLTERTKDEIESLGFTQVITGVTRTWPWQQDSLLDQCWLNKPDRLISYSNEVRGISDHNYISVVLRTKDNPDRGHEVQRRSWKLFDKKRFHDKISNIDWSEFYCCQDINVLNEFFVDKVGGILQSEAPMRFMQMKAKYANWLDDEMLRNMKHRDSVREKARQTGIDEDWTTYRKSRNICSKMLNTKKIVFYSNIFNNLHEEKM